MRLVSIITTALYSILYLLSRVSSKQYVPVLVYHSVDSNDSFFNVAPNEFARQMEHLRRNYAIVSVEEVFEFVMGRRDLPRRSVAITCDDGYYDNYLDVYPYVKKYGFPVAIFVASGYVGKWMSLGNVPLRMLSWEELAEMSQDKVTIGAHTLTHPDLRRIDLEEARNQIVRSKADIEGAIGQPVNYFSYPYGAYTSALVVLLRSLGFMAAFGGDGLVFQGDNRYVLRRVSIDASVSFLMFRAKLTVATEWYREIVKAVAGLVHRLPFLSGIAMAYNRQ